MAARHVETNQYLKLQQLYNQLNDWEFWNEPEKLTLAQVYRRFNVDIETDEFRRFLFEVLKKARRFAEAPQQHLGTPEMTVDVNARVLQWCGYGADSDAYPTTLKKRPHLNFEEVRGQRISLPASDFESSLWYMRLIDPDHLLTYRRMLLVYDKYIEYERDYLSRSVDRLEEEKLQVQNENDQLKAKLQAVVQAVLQAAGEAPAAPDDDVAGLAVDLDEIL